MTEEERASDCVSGVSIQQLSSVSILLSDDEMLISEPYLGVRWPANWRSKKISFMQLSAKLLEDISAAWKFGSMAWENSDDYAEWDHSHTCYNKVTDVSCMYENNLSDTVDLGTIAVGSRTYHLRMPEPVIIGVDVPVVGQLKFNATQDAAQTIDWTLSGFDGWVYPDGSLFPLSAFDIDGEFETEGDSFRVPVLSDFIRLNPKPYVSVDMDQDYSDFVPEHTHTVDISLSGEARGHFKYRATSLGSGSNSHGASKQDTIYPYSVDFDYSDIRITDTGYVASSEEVGKESAPSHTLVRTMIYIGLPKTETI